MKIETMKLGAAYNALTGIELLEHSIRSIRSNVDYIVVVVNNVSKHKVDMRPIVLEVERLRSIGLVDEAIFKGTSVVTPKYHNATLLEGYQRTVGMEMCRENGCTHFMTIDCDELYDGSQFAKAKDEIYRNNYDSSVCRLLSYYKYSNVIIEPMEAYFVPFIYKMNHTDDFSPKRFPYLVDPSRIYTVGKVREFKPDELVMHHLTYIRKDMLEKLLCSPAEITIQRAKEIVDHYNAWNYDRQVYTYNGFFDYKVVKPIYEDKVS